MMISWLRGKGLPFFVGIEYERLPSFCSECQTIGHMTSECRKRNMDLDEEKGLGTRSHLMFQKRIRLLM